jgi:hypothetical protein
MKAGRLTVSRKLLGHFEEKGEGFLWRIVTGDEALAHHYDPKKKQSMEYQPKGSPTPKKFKSSLCWKSHVDCIMCYSELRTLH